MGQLSLFSRDDIARMRDRTAARNYSAAGEEFRREHQRHRNWGLRRRHAQKLRHASPGGPASPTAPTTRNDPSRPAAAGPQRGSRPSSATPHRTPPPTARAPRSASPAAASPAPPSAGPAPQSASLVAASPAPPPAGPAPRSASPAVAPPAPPSVAPHPAARIPTCERHSAPTPRSAAIPPTTPRPAVSATAAGSFSTIEAGRAERVVPVTLDADPHYLERRAQRAVVKGLTVDFHAIPAATSRINSAADTGHDCPGNSCA